MSELSKATLIQLSHVAINAAKQAGQLIHSVDPDALTVKTKQAGSSKASQVVTQVDTDCEQLITSILLKACPSLNIALLSEESANEDEASFHQRLNSDYFWCIDPLDGTLPYINKQAGYAVAIALVSKNGEALIGVVYHPPSQSLYCAVKGCEPTINEHSLTKETSSDNRLHAYFDRSFCSDPRYAQVIKKLESLCQSLNLGRLQCYCDSGAVINALSTLNHSQACYFKLPKEQPGGGSLWDFSATTAIVKSAGGWASNIVGEPLELNRPDSNFMNHQGVLFASKQQLAEAIMQSMRTI